MILNNFNDELEELIQELFQNLEGWNIINEIIENTDNNELQVAATQLIFCSPDTKEMPDDFWAIFYLNKDFNKISFGNWILNSKKIID